MISIPELRKIRSEAYGRTHRLARFVHVGVELWLELLNDAPIWSMNDPIGRTLDFGGFKVREDSSLQPWAYSLRDGDGEIV